MYSTVLLLHSWLRWVALLAAIFSLFALMRSGEKAPAQAERFVLTLVIALDLQLLLGLLLYFALSPFTAEAMQNFGLAMRNPQLRFWAVEHITTMFGAIIAVHVGRVMARKASGEGRRTTLLVSVGIALLLMLVGIPWPGMANGRPLFRM